MGEGKNLVGVDIGASSIKVCQLREGRRGYGLIRAGYVPLAPQAFMDGRIADRGLVIEALGRVFQDAKIRQKDVAIGVSGQNVIIRKITVPLMTAEELREQIRWEAEQHIPFDIKEVEIDYQVLRRRPEASQMDLLLVAAKRDQIAEYAQLVRDARLRPLVCDIVAFTLQNGVEMSRGLPADQTIAVLNVGATLASLNIVAGGISAFTRDIASGGNVITEEVMKQLNVPFDQAEAYKCGGGDAGMVPAQALQIIEAVTDSIAAEIQRSIDFFMATSGENGIRQIYVTGGSANLTQLGQAIQRRSRVPVELWSPFERVGVEAREVDQGMLAMRAPQFAVALGLGLRKDKESRA